MARTPGWRKGCRSGLQGAEGPLACPPRRPSAPQGAPGPGRLAAPSARARDGRGRGAGRGGRGGRLGHEPGVLLLDGRRLGLGATSEAAGERLRSHLLLHLRVLRGELVVLGPVDEGRAAQGLADGLHVVGELLHVVLQLVHLPDVDPIRLLLQLGVACFHRLDRSERDLSLLLLELQGLHVELRSDQLVSLLLVHLLALHGLQRPLLGCGVAATLGHMLPDLLICFGYHLIQVLDLTRDL
mmetsp:Transcript_1620/g.3221  ORF Transcript_1620/g.3221 Transcript_1620/m.3221 type:complete len:241 (+) Transcript_1620:134-856(+)